MDCARSMQESRVCAGAGPVAGFAMALLWLLCGSSVAATPIYKCIGPDMRVLYTDVPCPNGERLDIRAGDADPDAVSRVERERDALARSATQRIADERSALAPRQVVAESVDARGKDAGTASDAAYYPYGWGLVPYYPPRHPVRPDARPEPRPDRPSYIVPKQPPLPPRR